MNLEDAVARLSTLAEHNDALVERVTSLKTEVDDLRSRNESLEIRVAKLVHQLYGRKAESLDPATLLEGIREHLAQSQLELTGGSEPVPSKEPEPEFETVTRKKPSKKLDPEGLPQETREIAVPEEERICSGCGEEMPVIAHDEIVRYGFQQVAVLAIAYLLEKRACKCGKGIVTAKAPEQAIPRCKAEPELLAHVVVSKHQDGLPLYRQAKILERQGFAIGDTTLGEWCRQVSDVLAPVELELRKQVLAERYLQIDETGLKVQAKGGCKSGWLWGYGKPGDQMFFDFRRSRSRDGPNEILADYSGTVQTDGYSVYDGLAIEGPLVHVACWTHARRKFLEAKDASKKRAGRVLKLAAKLYRIEEIARKGKYSAEERRVYREERARLILEEIRQALDSYRSESTYLPKSLLGQAVEYALKLWERLTNYVEHGEVEIDNNLVENSMRMVAVARKNFLFAGSEAGAERAAQFFSLLESCRRLGINPHEYLTDVLRRLPQTAPDAMGTLTPREWKAGREQEVLES